MKLLPTALTVAALQSLAFAQAPDPLPSPDTLPPLVTRSDAQLEIESCSHIMRFDRDGAMLSVPSAIPGRPATLSVALTDWGRSGATHHVTRRPPEHLTDDLVEHHHTGIVERYRITADGFEQSFVIPSRPAGEGDLVLGITATSTELHADAIDAAHRALDFCDADGRVAIRYGEAFAFGRGEPRVAIATRHDGRGRIELVVPAALLASATFPLIVDPAVGPQLLLGGFASLDGNPDCAFDALNQVFCAVWQRQVGTNDVRIRAMRVSRDGNAIGSTIAVTGAGFFGTPTITTVNYNNTQRFFLVWSGSTGLMGQYMDPTTGAMLGSAQALTSVPLGTRDRRPTVGAGGGRIVVAWDRTPSGTAEPQEIRVRAMTVSTAQSVALQNEHVIESTVFGYVRRPRMPRSLLFQGAPLVRLCWERFYITPAPGDTDLRTASFSIGSGISYLQNIANVTGAFSVGVDERSPDIAAIEGLLTPNYLIAWQENGDVMAARYELNGAVGGEFAIAAAPAYVESEPAVGAGSTEFCVGYLRADLGTPNVTHMARATRVLASGTGVESDRELFSAAGWTNAAPRASSVAAVTGADKSNAVLFTWANVSTPGGAQDDIRAQLFEPVTVQATPFGVGCPGPNGSTPTIAMFQRATPGNQDFAMVVNNAPANSLAALLISDQLTTTAIPGAPGCSLYAGLPVLVVLPTITNVGGAASITVPIPIGAPPGVTLAFQWVIHTPGHNPFGWIVSPDIDLNWYQ